MLVTARHQLFLRAAVSNVKADKFGVNMELPDHVDLFSSKRTEGQLTQSEPAAKTTKVRV